MSLGSFLKKNKKSIVEKWRDLIFDSYPDVTSRFLKKEKDRFANPVGYDISKCVPIIYDELLSDEADTAKLSEALENIMKVRAVQDFTAFNAAAFVFFLKTAVRKTLDENGESEKHFRELLEFESQIDSIALLTFEVYVKCRERLHEVRTKEIKASYALLKKRFNIGEFNQ